MANLTISLDDEVLKQARIRALEQGTSINALLRAYLEDYAGDRTRRQEAMNDLLSRARASRSGKDGSGRRWIRNELHDR